MASWRNRVKFSCKSQKYVAGIASYLNANSHKLRERSVNALGIIGRADKNLIMPYLEKLQWFADNDIHPVARIHGAGAVRITKRALERRNSNI